MNIMHFVSNFEQRRQNNIHPSDVWLGCSQHILYGTYHSNEFGNELKNEAIIRWFLRRGWEMAIRFLKEKKKKWETSWAGEREWGTWKEDGHRMGYSNILPSCIKFRAAYKFGGFFTSCKTEIYHHFIHYLHRCLCKSVLLQRWPTEWT